MCSVEERLSVEMAHVRSLSQQLSNAESLNTELDEHTKAVQAAAAARTAGVFGREAKRVALSASVFAGERWI